MGVLIKRLVLKMLISIDITYVKGFLFPGIIN